jgi:RND family efflux transporter MFP subunit
VEVGTEVSGKIEKIYKDYNETVKKGDLLAKIDTETLELNAQEAKASLLSAEANARDSQLDVDLLRDLVKKKMAAEYDLKKAEIKNEQSIQNVERAKLTYQKTMTNLKNAYIYSPIDGVIVSRSVDEGQTVAASLNAPTLFNIADDLRKMQIDALVDEADIGKIQLQMPVRFTVDAYPEESFRGRVKQVRLDPQNDSNVITYKVIIEIDNPDMLLLPGMTANVTIIVNQKYDILTIPSRATQFKPSKEVWESFGLEWNDSLLARGKRGGFGGGGQMGFNKADFAKDNTTGSPSRKTDSKNVNAPKAQQTQDQPQGLAQGNRPRMSREEFEKLSPEERQKLREKFGRMRQQREENSQSVQPKIINSQSVDIFKLRKAYDSNQTQRASVWVLENGTPKKVSIMVGMSDGQRIEVLSGLKPGQKVILGVNGNDQNTNKTNTMMPMGGMGPR